ncbi:MurR/RpiR family transcriptional regulator [Streptococcus sp.]|uniref:MurR/RpiR family transcriptional regulator n=1 Tax=Streptococcus sp. TaxID=1306 RepID=UPI0035A0989D
MEIEKLLNGKKVSELERTILTYLSENQKQLGSLNIQQIAKATYTSTSTVFRLAKKLGFAGYSEMVYKLSNHGLNTNFSESVSENARLFSNLINQVFQENQLQIIECGKCLSHKEKTIFILGTGYSGIIAEYLYKKLLGKGNYVLFSNGADTNALFLNNLNRIDIVICISKSGETALINDKAKKAKLHNIPIISFTQGGTNTLSAMSDFPFIVNDQNHYDWNNIQTSQFYPMLLFYLEYFVEKNF